MQPSPQKPEHLPRRFGSPRQASNETRNNGILPLLPCSPQAKEQEAWIFAGRFSLQKCKSPTAASLDPETSHHQDKGEKRHGARQSKRTQNRRAARRQRDSIGQHQSLGLMYPFYQSFLDGVDNKTRLKQPDTKACVRLKRAATEPSDTSAVGIDGSHPIFLI